MAIRIDPNRINTGGSAGIRHRERPSTARQDNVVIPKRAHVNHIPSPASLATLINSAVENLRRGVFWDRGTILNLLV